MNNRQKFLFIRNCSKGVGSRSTNKKVQFIVCEEYYGENGAGKPERILGWLRYTFKQGGQGRPQ